MIKGATGGDYIKTLLFLKGCKITDEDFLNEEFDFVKALMINKDMLGDPFVKQKIYNMIKKRISEAKKGVLQVQGNYSIVSGDLYALCQHMFNMPITGLLKRNEFYSRTWLDKGVNKVVAFRAPMTVHNNIKIFNFVENDNIDSLELLQITTDKQVSSFDWLNIDILCSSCLKEFWHFIDFETV
jgi:hypothetical protein